MEECSLSGRWLSWHDPAVRSVPGFKNCSGPLLDSVDQGASLEDPSGKLFHKLMVKTLSIEEEKILMYLILIVYD